MTAQLVPVTLTQCRRFIGEHHRHNLPPRGWLFGVGLAPCGGQLCGVGVASIPRARKLMQADPFLIEITRTCVVDTPNGNSQIYGALCRAAKALGYRRVITYTLAAESGASLKASGFVVDAELPAVAGLGSTDTPALRDRPVREHAHPGRPEDPMGAGAVKAAGEVARLTYDTESLVDVGDVIETSTGRRYLVTAAKPSRSCPKGYTGAWRRWTCETLVLGPDDATPDGATVHPLYWYPRSPRPRLA